jgi:TolB-like protein
VSIFGSPKSATAKLYRVAVVPFKINAEKDMSFLRDGITDMLTSRLAWEDKVAVLTREETFNVLQTVALPLNESKARKIGARLKVDYVLFGSLTVFGNSVSIDAKMVDVSGSKPPLTFFSQSPSMDQVIPGINHFATDINAKIFGRDVPTGPVYSQPQPAQEQINSRAHPDKLIAGGFGEIDEPGTQKPAPGTAFMPTGESRISSSQFWKSPRLKQRINGIAVGDVDSDGKMETVIITPHTVELYRFENKRFYKVTTTAKHGLDNFIGVGVADINGNGYPEIFVSSLNPHKNMVNSFVLEFNGQTYTEIVKDSHWYFRVVDHPGRGRILLGQRHKTASPFDGQIYEMTWENSGYSPANKVGHPRRCNVMGFAFGNAMNDGGEVAVAFDDLDYLKIASPAGREIWKGGQHSGGSPEYYVMEAGSAGEFEKRAYYPARIIIRDVNRDGKNEVITIKNHRLSELISYRKFTHGEIEVRSWDGIGLAVHWKTRKLSGYFSDFAIGDFDNDGQDELAAALVIKSGAVATTTPKSTVIVYELQ